MHASELSLGNLQDIFDQAFVGKIHHAYFSRMTDYGRDDASAIYVALVEQENFPPMACELIVTPFETFEDSFDIDFVQVGGDILGYDV